MTDPLVMPVCRKLHCLATEPLRVSASAGNLTPSYLQPGISSNSDTSIACRTPLPLSFVRLMATKNRLVCEHFSSRSSRALLSGRKSRHMQTWQIPRQPASTEIVRERRESKAVPWTAAASQRFVTRVATVNGNARREGSVVNTPVRQQPSKHCAAPSGCITEYNELSTSTPTVSRSSRVSADRIRQRVTLCIQSTASVHFSSVTSNAFTAPEYGDRERCPL